MIFHDFRNSTQNISIHIKIQGKSTEMVFDFSLLGFTMNQIPFQYLPCYQFS